MALAGQRNGVVENEDDPVEDKASMQTPATSTSVTPRRGLRERGPGRPRSGVSALSADMNGASSSPQGSGRVLRDRSTRAVPAWLKDTKSEEDEEETNVDAGATKRRKVSNSRRKKISESAGLAEGAVELAGDSLQGTASENAKKHTTVAEVPPAQPSRRPAVQTRAKAPPGRAARSSARPVCKTEPGTENPVAAAVGEELHNKKEDIKKKEDGNDATEPVLEDDNLSRQQEAADGSVEAQSQSGAEEGGVSTDEDAPYRDDLNDQSYDPKGEREVPKLKRKAPLSKKEKKDKEKAPKKEKEVAEIKVEGSENVDNVEDELKVEDETLEDPDGPRKRGRRKKDDKTPRLPKRRKKPPVQYVRCEMEGCGTVLAHPRYLQHHIKYQHLLKKKYVCPHPSCGRLFRLQKQLLRHAKHHTDQRDYICEFCARAFKSSHNLAVHRMIHTGEKPLQCEICGFTCRQKASLNWHMKKHDADATYQFSCSICGKKFEKKDCVVAHKAKSHPEVLIAEALAANAGALITTPASLLELSGNPAPAEVANSDMSQVGQSGPVEQLSQEGPAGQQVAQQVANMGHTGQQVSHQVVLLGQDQNIHTMQVPVTIALSPIDPPSPAGSQQQHLQLQMPVQFVQAAAQQQQQQQQMQQLTLHSSPVVTQQQQLQPLQPLQSYTSQQQQSQAPAQILQMTFQPISQSQANLQQIPILATSQPLQTASSPPLLAPAHSQQQGAGSANGDGFILDNPVLCSSAATSSSQQQSVDSLQQAAVAGEDTVVWEPVGQGEVLSDGRERHVQQALM